MNEIARRVTFQPSVAPAVPFSRAGRLDASAALQARADYNAARLACHRAELETIVEKARAKSRVALARDAMQNVVEVSAYARALAGGDDALAMTLGDIVQAFNSGELARIVKRGFDD